MVQLANLKAAQHSLTQYLNSQTVSKEADDSALAVQQAMVEWVRSLGNWEVFGTLTVRPPAEKEKARGYEQRGRQYVWRKYQLVLKEAQSILRYKWHGQGTIQSFGVLELHDSGVPHIHYLLELRSGLRGPEARELYCELLQYESFRLAGHAKVGWISEEHGDPVKYVTKYVSKEVTGDSIRYVNGRGEEVRM